MNREQREIWMEKIHKLEGLLAYAREHAEFEEAQRLEKELVEMMERI